MATLQKIVLGTPPKGEDGDTVRASQTKANANVDVLNAQLPIVSAGSPITVPYTALNAGNHLGRRVAINLTGPGPVQMPAASTCSVDGVVLLSNIGAIAAQIIGLSGAGDSVAISSLNPGESALMATDGVHGWSCLMRGRSGSDNETVNGALSVGGALSVAGALSVTAGITAKGSLTATSSVGVNGPAETSRYVMFYTGGVARWSAQASYDAENDSNAGSSWLLGRHTNDGSYAETVLSFSRSTGVGAFAHRPMFGSATPWDSANLPTPQAALGYVPINKAGDSGIGALAVTSLQAPSVFVGSAGYMVMYDTGSSGIGFRAGTSAAPKYFSFDASGNGYAANGSWVNGSDADLKQNVETIDDALSKVRALRGVSYEKIGVPGSRHLGVIAQEVQQVFPEVVHDMPGADNEGGRFLGVSYGNLVGPLIEALKILADRVDALESSRGVAGVEGAQ
ncbi:tail fiber domain-containing protein [Burkholderia perseverans]|uniref:tail fiber domain-containing protein n=1 Tax=Burkholderia perseverans TaxID=2615214 RepID=UPI001FEE6349|nr:tail fiber domain-containing protein [Burkholderia perseverans]